MNCTWRGLDLDSMFRNARPFQNRADLPQPLPAVDAYAARGLELPHTMGLRLRLHENAAFVAKLDPPRAGARGIILWKALISRRVWTGRTHPGLRFARPPLQGGDFHLPIAARLHPPATAAPALSLHARSGAAPCLAEAGWVPGRGPRCGGSSSPSDSGFPAPRRAAESRE